MVNRILSYALISLVAITVVGCTSGQEPVTPATPKVAEPSAEVSEPPAYGGWELALLEADIKVGDCLDASQTLTVVPCNGPHYAEVYSIVDFAGVPFADLGTKVSEGYVDPVTADSYLGGPIPMVDDPNGSGTTMATFGINSASAFDNEELFNAGATRAIYTVTPIPGPIPGGSIAGSLGG